MFDWQTIVALIIVAVAAMFVIREFSNVALRKKSGSCGSCAACPSNQLAANEKPLVSLELSEPQEVVDRR